MEEEQIGADTPVIRYREGNLAPLRNEPFHFRCGLYFICNEGNAIVSTGAERYLLAPRSELIFLSGSLIRLEESSTDFRVRLLLFPKETFLRAVLPIDTPYLNYAYEHPFYQHTDDERSRKTWREAMLWMDLSKMLFAENDPQFRSLQEHAFLQSLLIWLFNTIPEKRPAGVYTRKQLLCHRFMQLVREHGAREHQVAFYADRLCVTPRYLHEAVTVQMEGRTPKQLIDEQLVAEVKALLNDPGTTVTEIAERLNFADQSYLTRFFKRNTGLSPREYRTPGDHSTCIVGV